MPNACVGLGLRAVAEGCQALACREGRVKQSLDALVGQIDPRQVTPSRRLRSSQQGRSGRRSPHPMRLPSVFSPRGDSDCRRHRLHQDTGQASLPCFERSGAQNWWQTLATKNKGAIRGRWLVVHETPKLTSPEEMPPTNPSRVEGVFRVEAQGRKHTSSQPNSEITFEAPIGHRLTALGPDDEIFQEARLLHILPSKKLAT